jgi:glycerate kinase
VKILIIPDKFKGTLTAGAAAEAIAHGWKKSRPHDSLTLLPMSDGGDGFGEVLGQLLGAKLQKIKTVDAAHRPCEAHWWWEPKTKTAVIESASVIGLAKLPPKKFHPFELDTFGLGAVIRAAAARGTKRCIIGIGGSATNDAGFGVARALGWKFFDRSDTEIERWTELHKLARVVAPEGRRWFRNLTVAVDVQNPLLGPRGATRVYGPQKGLLKKDFTLAEKCLRRLAHLCSGGLQPPPSSPGSGAAGGLGFGLMTFLSAKLEPGFHLFSRLAELEKHLRAADLVITGEGRIDKSTFMGKGVGEIAARCEDKKIPCIAFAGVIASTTAADRAFTAAHALSGLTTVEKAKSHPIPCLTRLAAQIALHF